MSTWPTVRLGEVTESMKNGIYKPASAYAEDGYACLRMYNIGDGKLVWRDIKRMHLSKRELSEYRLLPGDLLVNRVNSRELVGKAAVIPEGIEPLVFESKNIRLRLVADKANPKFINYQLLLNGRRHFSTNAQQVVGMASINQKQLADFSVVLPSLPVQQEAVAEIEQQFSRLDEAGANLKRVRANLKRYKAAVLKAAVEGKLTEDWRKRHPNVEPASRLLERILAERRAKWDGKGQYKEPGKPNVTDSTKLPQHWAWCLTDALFSFVTSGSRGWAQYYSDEGPLFLRVGNLDHDSIRLDLSDVQRVKPPAGAEGTRTRVESGDILISITADVGMIAVAPADLGHAYINQHVSLVRPLNGFCRVYLAWYLAARDGGQKMFLQLQRGATKAGLGLDDIRAVPVPLPPLAEQQEIVAEVERRLSVIEELEAAVNANLTRVNRLRQAILQQAFRGTLVE